MPSISHRASLVPDAPHRAKPGPAALPAGLSGGFIGGVSRAIRRIAGWPIRWCADRLEDWRALRQLRDLDDHLLRDIGLTAAEAQRATLLRHYRRRARDTQDPKGPPTWPTIS
jgi:uncharacterized protein YjiS (DUF1127 family)